ncbi:MAG: bifunctional phosphoribosylaminoimidazolecarboxamide formyltransferase/IMP cyclohydrolase [Trueperaceae bacterium]|nr:bifunctional phosphoribosylaminoimidazolecarboxamide formyltransferase/IMP cyclohydrolase [Trueperaceae bacterium]
MPRALISVSDKTGIVPFARALVALGFELVSTGGTRRALEEAGLTVTPVDAVTGAPEILDGRVKTLHPSVHGGILARDTPDHERELARHEIARFDLVAVNLYPFRETVASGDVSLDEAMEQVDIGGPTMLRAAAKNHGAVVVIVEPRDYDPVLDDLRGAGVSSERRRALARAAFAHTAAYDAAIVRYLDADETFPETLHLTLTRAEELRYGENPHQRGARYREEGRNRGWTDEATQHGGLGLSYLNLFDAEAAWRLAHEFPGSPCAVIVKHANPCGVALATDLGSAYERAFEADPKSAFGGVVALNGVVDAALADEIVSRPKADVLVARGYTPEALARFASKRKNMRVLEAPPPGAGAPSLRRVDGGFLVQGPDAVGRDRTAWSVVSEAQPSEALWRDLELAWVVGAYTLSNAIVLVEGGRAVGIGAGQQSRVDAADVAASKAAGRAAGGACASDAFYPFRDGLDAAAAAGVAGVIQPGGSLRDAEVIAAADEHGLVMVLTGERHFRH